MCAWKRSNAETQPKRKSLETGYVSDIRKRAYLETKTSKLAAETPEEAAAGKLSNADSEL